MRIIRQTVRRGPTQLLLLALIALVAVAVAVSAKETRRAKGDDGEVARGRIRSQPMTMLQGLLTQAGGDLWNVNGQAVRFERNYTLVDLSRSDGTGAPRNGANVMLMGYQRHGVFVAYNGLIMREAYQEAPPNDAARDHVRWSETDPTVGEADDSIPK